MTNKSALAHLGRFGQRSGLRQRLILSSTTFVAPFTGWYRIYALGAAGSGAVVVGSQGSAVGGGGAGFAYKEIYLAAGDTLTITIGAGGAAKTVTGNGNAGATTTVAGPGWTITITGGAGGTYTATATQSLTGALGGVASGGDVNFSGGQSGSIAALVANALAATGGASAASVYGAGQRSGSITGTLQAYGYATGGGSVLFASANIAAGAGHAVSDGAGTGAATGENMLGINTPALDGSSGALSAPNGGLSLLERGLPDVYNPFLRLLGGGVAGINTAGSITYSIPGPGAAMGGVVAQATANSLLSAGHGTYCGTCGGGRAAVSFNAFDGVAGRGGRGAGGGGLATVPTATSNAAVGGDGMVMIEY